jgi:hypothetical protein
LIPLLAIFPPFSKRKGPDAPPSGLSRVLTALNGAVSGGQKFFQKGASQIKKTVV